MVKFWFALREEIRADYSPADLRLLAKKTKNNKGWNASRRWLISRCSGPRWSWRFPGVNARVAGVHLSITS